MKKYRVTLTPDERQHLLHLTRSGKTAAYKLTHARILLKADQADDGPAWPDDQIAQALDVGLSTIARVRQRFVEQGLESARLAYHERPATAFGPVCRGGQPHPEGQARCRRAIRFRIRAKSFLGTPTSARREGEVLGLGYYLGRDPDQLLRQRRERPVRDRLGLDSNGTR